MELWSTDEQASCLALRMLPRACLLREDGGGPARAAEATGTAPCVSTCTNGLLAAHAENWQAAREEGRRGAAAAAAPGGWKSHRCHTPGEPGRHRGFASDKPAQRT